MALDFPANPTNGQTFGQYIYDSSIPGWRNQNSSEGIGLQFKSGLIPIIPSSVTISAGGASVASDGLITVTGGSAYISINNIFTSAYRNYKIVFNGQMGNSTGGVRLRQGGTDYTGTAYYYAGWRYWSNGTYDVYTGNGGNVIWSIFSSSAQNNHSVYDIDVYTPAIVGDTGIFTRSTGWDGAKAVTHNAIGMVHSDYVADGLSILTSGSVLFTGTVRVYGYN